MIIQRDPLRPSNQRTGGYGMGYGGGYGGTPLKGWCTPGDIVIRVCSLSLHRIFKEFIS